MSKNSSKSETAKTDLEARQKSLVCRNFLNATFLSRLPSALHFPGTLTYLKTLLIFFQAKVPLAEIKKITSQTVTNAKHFSELLLRKI